MIERNSGTAPRLVMVGDLMVGDAAIATGYGFASRWTEDRLPELVARIRPLLEGGDLVLANLECVLSRTGCQTDDWQSAQMRGWPAYAQALSDMGITHVTLANNHATQHGMAAFSETVALLEQAGIGVAGLAGSDGWCATPVVAECNGARVGLLAYSLRPRQYCKQLPQPYAEGTREGILADVQRLRPSVNALVVSLHWGEEYGLEPSADEVCFAHELVGAGVTVVHGHHPHVVRPVERYGSGVIAYSLGNFLSDLVWQEEFRQTVVWRVQANEIPAYSLDGAYIGKDFLPVRSLTAPWCRELAHSGLTSAEYESQTETSLMLQRRKAYVHALRNVPHFNRRVLQQLVLTTVQRRMQSLVQRFTRS